MTHDRARRASTADDTRRDLIAVRAFVAEIIPGGRNPEGSYMAKRDALRQLDRMIGTR